MSGDSCKGCETQTGNKLGHPNICQPRGGAYRVKRILIW